VSSVSSELTTTEQYILSQLLVCGAVTETEYENAIRDRFKHTVLKRMLASLESKGYLEEILYDNDNNK